MTKRERKRIAALIAEQELIIEKATDEGAVSEAKDRIVRIIASIRTNHMYDIIQIDEEVQKILQKNS